MGAIRAMRRLGNKVGLALWAKVETAEPNVTYWFGPFMTRRSLNNNLTIFLGDLADEGNQSIQHSIIRCRRSEPLTI